MDSLLDAWSLHTLSQFHFLRPWWALTLIPFVVVLLLQFKKNQISQRWRGIIAPHILKHLIVKQGGNKLFNHITLIALLMVVSVVVLMGPSGLGSLHLLWKMLLLWSLCLTFLLRCRVKMYSQVV